MSQRTLEKLGLTPTPPLGEASLGALPQDLLREASRRLGWAGLIYAVTFFLAAFGPPLAASGAGFMPDDAIWTRPVQTWASLVSIAMGLLVFAFARLSNLPPQRLLDLGLVFEVVGAAGISVSQFWGIFPVWEGPSSVESLMGIPWECVWIIVFPFLAPNTPGKVLIASLAAASTGLLTVTLSTAFGATDPATPLGVFVLYFGFTTYVCAGLAYFISRIVYRLGRRLKQAREIGSYRLLRRLGAGGMGEVWLAEHRMLVRPAAIKLIRADAVGSDAATAATSIQRFEREARSTAALGSQHTIEIFDFGITQDGAFYYVMELLDGLTLEELIRQFGPLPAARVIYLLRQVCHSLNEAHERGMIHRDVKPANIFACRKGPDHDYVKVLDFGLVKPTTPAKSAELSADGVAAGTPAFMAPEVALGKDYIDARVDIYGLGCVAYWLLTGGLVFDRESPLATALAHVQDEPVAPSRRSELEISPRLDRIVLRCLAKEPADRPQTVAAVSELLSGAADGVPWSEERAAEWWRLHLPDRTGLRESNLER